jgi:acyl-CoA synthetase (AMP-forming)/AMP-acid ligase II
LANHDVPFWYLHPRWAETVAAAVVAQLGHRLDESALIAACRAELARYKCPTSVRLLDELPRNATGKVLRRVVSGNPVPHTTTAREALASAHVVDVPPDIGGVG